MQAYKLIFLLGTLGFALALSACDITTPSDLNTSKLKIKDQVVTETFSTNQVDLKGVAAMSAKVVRNGNRGITLTVPYLPGGSVKARALGEAYGNAFLAQGVKHVSVALVEMTDPQDTKKVVATYQALMAKQTEDCGRIPGYQGPVDMDNYNGYQYGCETQGQLARMIADPTDLLGKKSPSGSDSRRNGAIIEPYMVGTPNQPLKGMSASSIGAQ